MIEKNPTSDYVASVILDSEEILKFDKDHIIFKNENVATYEVTPNFTYTNAADTDVLAYFNADSSSTGTAVVTITYA